MSTEKKIYEIPPDFKLEEYDYDLPQDLIAQYPVKHKGESRLLVMEQQKNNAFKITDSHFYNIAEFLPKNALLVANNVKVLQCRLPLTSSYGGKGEFLLLTPLPVLLEIQNKYAHFNQAQVECLLKPSSKFKIGRQYVFAPGLEGKILEKLEFGRHIIELKWTSDIENIFEQFGQLPLPPYIRRLPDNVDNDRYHTCYSKKIGALAAPTAGLHFTTQIKQEISAKGVEWQELTLYVGYGTFNPVRCEDIRQHKMHAELMEIDAGCATAINSAKREGRPIIAIGTTSLRALESANIEAGEIMPGKKWTDIFIYPDYAFNIVDGLVTNFHLPKSSLLMLVSAFAGRENIIKTYKYAISRSYRFFSYGDAMFMLKQNG